MLKRLLAGLVGVLSGKTNYTVFAPTNAAFNKVPKTKSAKTAEGSKVAFSVRGKNAFVNDSKITETDILRQRDHPLDQRRPAAAGKLSNHSGVLFAPYKGEKAHRFPLASGTCPPGS